MANIEYQTEPGIPLVMVYNSPFGRFKIPPDVYRRAERLRHIYDDYLARWCEWQYKKQGRECQK